MAAMDGACVSGGLAKAIDECIDEWPAVGMVAAGVAGDEASDDRLARPEHGVGIDPALQQGEGEPGPEIRQDALQGGRGPIDQIAGIRSSSLRLASAKASCMRPRCLVSRCSAWLLGAGMWTGSSLGPPKPGMAARTWASARSVLACSER